MKMKRTRNTMLPLYTPGVTGNSPVSSIGITKLLHKHKTCETYIIPLMPVAHQPCLGHVSSLLPHLRRWEIFIEGGYLIKHPGTGKLMPALLTFGADPADANTLAVMAGFDWTLHVFFYVGKPAPKERGEFGHGYIQPIQWYFKKEIHD